MRRCWHFLVMAVFLPALVFAQSPPAARTSDRQTVFHPLEDTNAVLHNPDMGWVLYENYPLDRDPHGSSTMLTLPNDNFDGVDNVALMFSWQDVETSENTYDFSHGDAAYDYWRARGKAIQLRLSAESLMFWEQRNPPAGKGVPDYLLARLAPDEKQTRTLEGNSYTVVDARNPFYRERLAAFLRAVREHFNDRRPVTLIDLRGFGVWGEWHSGFRYPSLEAKHAALSGVLDIWSEQFPRHMLALSYSYDPDGPKELYGGPNDQLNPAFTTNYDAFLRYSAFDRALTRSNLTFRRDGCGGAVHSNERKLNEEAFTIYHRAPMAGEFLGGYNSMKAGGSNWVTWVVHDALSLHPNYLNLIGWQGADARDFLRERPDLFALGQREMGYRLVPTKITCTLNSTNPASFKIQMDWQNRGTGRALRDYELTFSLIPQGQTNALTSAPFPIPTSQWVKGRAYSTEHNASFGKISPGKYRLAFTMRDSTDHRAIALPLTGSSTPNDYDIGEVLIPQPQ